MIDVFVYQKCSTCRNALKWLDDHGVRYRNIAIREQPPSVAQLKKALPWLGGDLRKLFNTSGIDYRALQLKDRLPSLTPQEAFDLLSRNGNLVKRPFVLGPNFALVGFKPDDWKNTLL